MEVRGTEVAGRGVGRRRRTVVEVIEIKGLGKSLHTHTFACPRANRLLMLLADWAKTKKLAAHPTHSLSPHPFSL